MYTPGWREALWEQSVFPKNTAQSPRPELKPSPLDLDSHAITIKQMRHPYALSVYNNQQNR